MSRDDHVQLEGEIVLVAAGGNFRVRTESGHEILAQLAGRMRGKRIRVVLGDKVTEAVSGYDAHRGLIVYRTK